MPSYPLRKTLDYIKRDSVMYREDYLTCLYRQAEQVNDNGLIVEIGCYRGDSTIALLAGSDPSVQVITIDPIFQTGELTYPDVNEGTLTLCSKFETVFKRINGIIKDMSERCFSIVPLTSKEALECWKPGEILTWPDSRWGQGIDLILIDGEHTYDAAITDCNWLDHVKFQGACLIDDWMEPIERGVRESLQSRSEWTIAHQGTNAAADDLCVTLLVKS